MDKSRSRVLPKRRQNHGVEKRGTAERLLERGESSAESKEHHVAVQILVLYYLPYIFDDPALE